MKRYRGLLFAGIILAIVLQEAGSAAAIAFPGAEGSGRFSTGGRGGTVYEVTNLNNSGAGSIVDAVSVGNRTIVFRVSGTINLGDVLLRPKSNTTIAGQTAPGDGICLKGRIYISASNVVIRYLRVRVDAGGANSSGDAVDIAGGSNIIIDHVTASYARDEAISCQNGSNNVTVQWCILSESLTFESHSYGSLIRGAFGEKKSYHHNLYVHNNGRNPRPGNYTAAGSDPDGLYFDYRNNVVYNWKGTTPGYNADTTSVSRYNFINNVFIAGSESSVANKAFKEDSTYAYGYWSGNAYGTTYGTASVPVDQWSLVTFNGFDAAQVAAYKAKSYLVPMEPVTTTTAAQAKADVTAKAGSNFPVRDVIDMRIVNDVLSDTGHSIATTAEQPEGGWPVLNSVPAPPDSDHDGMPDAWEYANGLNAFSSADRNLYTFSTDYTNLEVYLNSLLAADMTAPAAPTGLLSSAGDGTVILSWNHNTEPDLAGYNVYRSETSGSGYVKLNVPLVTTWSYTDDTAAKGNTYYYVVTAVDTSLNESAYSSELFACLPDLNFYRDSNTDGRIDLLDLSSFWDVWLESDCLRVSGWDINADCLINYDEFNLLAAYWLENRSLPLITLQENEIGFCGTEGTIDTEHTGFTGTGYANTTNAAGSGIHWRINVLAAGTYTFHFRFASTAARPANLMINGVTAVPGIDFANTGAWTMWNTTIPADINLNAGIHTIRLEATTSGGLGNIDYLQISGAGLLAAECP